MDIQYYVPGYTEWIFSIYLDMSRYIYLTIMFSGPTYTVLVLKRCHPQHGHAHHGTKIEHALERCTH